MTFFTLSPDQEAASNAISDLFLGVPDDKHSVAVLTGSAGVGKSTVLQNIIQDITSKRKFGNVIYGATTHRAARVLETMVGAEVKTVHAMFGLRPSINRYGKQIIKQAGTPEIPHNSIVAIDEGSMLGNEILKAIFPTIRDLGLKVIIIGDPFQLPPVNDTCSLFDGSLPTFELTTVHRQAQGNPILDKAIEYRDYIRGDLSVEPALTTNLNSIGEGIHMLPHEDFVTAFVRRYMDYDTGAEVEAPLCTYTNASAINYNSMVRKAAYFLEDTVEPYYPGERLISNSAVLQHDRVLLTNNESVTVVKYAQGNHQDIPGYFVTVSGKNSGFLGSSTERVVFIPNSTTAANKVLDELKRAAKKSAGGSGWFKYYDLKNYLADLRPPFAGTTHKAQGGTFKSVFIDRQNIMKCHDDAVRARLMYVALTRATTDAYINA